MKKEVLAILLGISIFAFSGCTTSVSPQSKEAVSNIPDAGYKLSGESFQMISSFDYTSYGSGNQNGFYSVFLNDDGSFNIMYTDYATRAQVYLCAKPNCEHNSAACTSWIAPFTGTIIPAATEKDLFLLYSSREERPKIEHRGLNGEDPKTVFSLPDGAKIQNAVAANDTTLVVGIEQYETNEQTIKSDYYLTAIDWATGKESVIFSLNEQLKDKKFHTSSMLFHGVTAEAFIVETIVQFDYKVDMNDIDKSFENLNAALEHTVYEIPFDGSEPRPLLSYSNGKCGGRAFSEGFFYVEEDESHKISLKKITTGTEQPQLLIDNLSETLFPQKGRALNVEDVVFRNYVDGHLLLNALADDYIADNGNIELVFSGFSVEVKTGAVKKIELTNYYNATTVPVDIIANSGSNLLVFANIAQENGSSRLIKRKIGLIAAQDYLNSRPNYYMIDTLRDFN